MNLVDNEMSMKHISSDGGQDILIRVDNLGKTYNNGIENIEVLNGISINVSKGEMLGILGVSGAGKSTLLNILGTIDKPSSGKVSYFDKEDIFSLKDKELARFRNEKIGFIFQFHYLLREFTALENTMIPALIQRKSLKEAKKRALLLLGEVGLKERLNNRPGQLSGGEQQRVAIARALINNPDVVLADELTGNLDRKNTENIYRLLGRLNKQFNQTFIIVTHNEKLSEGMDRVKHLIDGKCTN